MILSYRKGLTDQERSSNEGSLMSCRTTSVIAAGSIDSRPVSMEYNDIFSSRTWPPPPRVDAALVSGAIRSGGRRRFPQRGNRHGGQSQLRKGGQAPLGNHARVRHGGNGAHPETGDLAAFPGHPVTSPEGTP